MGAPDSYTYMQEVDIESCATEDDSANSSAEDFSEIVKKARTRDFEDLPIQLLSDRHWFQYVIGAVIMLNTLVISLEAAFVQREDVKPLFAFLETAFMVVYVLEISIRLRELGVATFFCGSDSGWNWFDFLVTFSGVLDTILESIGASGIGASAGRLFRVLRILRLFRAFRFLNEIDYVIYTAGRAVLKLAFIVTLVVFVAGIVVTNLLWDVSDKQVASWFSDLGQSMWTMFKLMTLENWIGTVEQAAEAKPGILPLFVCFIFVASIAIMSLVPAIFIELNLSDRDKLEQLRIAQERESVYKSKRRVLKHLFKLVDRDDSGFVSVSEMSTALKTNSRMNELLQAGLATEAEVRDMKLGLFELWERKIEEHEHNDVELTEEEFLSGVLQCWDVIDEKHMWRNLTASRRQLRELTRLVKKQQEQLERQQMQLNLLVRLSTPNIHVASVGNATKGELSAGNGNAHFQESTGFTGTTGTSSARGDWSRQASD